MLPPFLSPPFSFFHPTRLHSSPTPITPATGLRHHPKLLDQFSNRPPGPELPFGPPSPGGGPGGAFSTPWRGPTVHHHTPYRLRPRLLEKQFLHSVLLPLHLFTDLPFLPTHPRPRPPRHKAQRLCGAVVRANVQFVQREGGVRLGIARRKGAGSPSEAMGEERGCVGLVARQAEEEEQWGVGIGEEVQRMFSVLSAPRTCTTRFFSSITPEA
mmetsp:Transcript_7306/g.17813  ORF Transcript_7306/g.17813 Transcript_7306/m.17813 type:complete len:213 (+) Transcript_7306:2702-3340(+)